MKTASAAEHTDSIMATRVGNSRLTATDLVNETLTESKGCSAGSRDRCKTCRTKVKCRNIENFHHLPPPTMIFARLELRKDSIECHRCVNSSQHVLHFMFKCVTSCILRLGVAGALLSDTNFRNRTNVLRHREQSDHV